jgi:hypothetical protein
MTTGLSKLPDFLRLSYFHGQMLDACDFQREQSYFVEKLRLRNRCLHGYGVACGLQVSPVPSDDECATGPDPHQPRVMLHPGVAVDCIGNEIVIRNDCRFELRSVLSEQDLGAFRDGGCVYLCVEYCERAAGPTRGVYVDSCGGSAECGYGWRQDSYRIRGMLTEPDNDGCGDACCDCCGESGPRACLLLARIDNVRMGKPVQADAIHLGVRRPLSRVRFTTITGINWQHGAYYSIERAAEILGTHEEDGGLRVHFSQDVYARCLTRGVVDVQVTERGRRAGTYVLDGRIEDREDEGFTRHLRWRPTSREPLQEGDRVLITVRTPFILDRCCRPVDGIHVGGRVPLLSGCEPAHHEPDFCTTPPSGVGPWTSGTGTGSGAFESWFFVTENHERERAGRRREDRR